MKNHSKINRFKRIIAPALGIVCLGTLCTPFITSCGDDAPAAAPVVKEGRVLTINLNPKILHDNITDFYNLSRSNGEGGSQMFTKMSILSSAKLGMYFSVNQWVNSSSGDPLVGRSSTLEAKTSCFEYVGNTQQPINEYNDIKNISNNRTFMDNIKKHIPMDILVDFSSYRDTNPNRAVTKTIDLYNNMSLYDYQFTKPELDKDDPSHPITTTIENIQLNNPKFFNNNPNNEFAYNPDWYGILTKNELNENLVADNLDVPSYLRITFPQKKINFSYTDKTNKNMKYEVNINIASSEIKLNIPRVVYNS